MHRQRTTLQRGFCTAARAAVRIALATFASGIATGAGTADGPDLLSEVGAKDVSTPIRLGPLNVHPSAKVQAFYDSNLFISSSNATGDEIFSFSPKLRVCPDQWEQAGGAAIEVSYAPDFVCHVHNAGNNSVDHHVAGKAGWELARLNCRIEHHYDVVSGAVVEVGRRLRQAINQMEIFASYRAGEKFLVGTGLQQTLTDNDGAIGSKEWSGNFGSTYDLTPKLALGVGTRLGVLDVQDQSGQTYEQGLLLSRYQVSGRLSVKAEAGLEVRQFDSARGDSVSPVFRVQGEYLLGAKTALSIEASRASHNSAALVDENFTLTGIRFSVNQELASKLDGRLSLAYNLIDYQAAGLTIVPARVDSFYEVRTELAYHPAQRWSATVFAQYRTKQSDLAANEFSQVITGLSISYNH